MDTKHTILSNLHINMKLVKEIFGLRRYDTFKHKDTLILWNQKLDFLPLQVVIVFFTYFKY